MRSAFGLENRADTSQLAIRFQGRTRVLFSPGGNLATPGSPGAYYSALWFSSATQGMEMKVVGTTLTFTPQTAFSNNSFDRNPNVAVFDGRGTAVTSVAALRIIAGSRDKFAEFGWDADDVAPYMVLYNATAPYTYTMNVGGTGFDIVASTFVAQQAQLEAFHQDIDRDGYTVIQMPPGSANVDAAVQVSNYAITPLTPLSDPRSMGVAFSGSESFLYMFNTVGALVKIVPGLAGALGATVVV